MKSIYTVLVFFIVSGCRKESANAEIKSVAVLKKNIAKEWKVYSMIMTKPFFSVLYNDCLKDYTSFSFKESGSFRYIHQSNAICAQSLDCPGLWTIPSSDSLKIRYNGNCSVGNFREFKILKITADTMRLELTESYPPNGPTINSTVSEYTFIPK